MPNDTHERRKTFVVAIVIAVLAVVTWTDIQSEMAFTENTRAGLYEAAYQQAVSNQK